MTNIEQDSNEHDVGAESILERYNRALEQAETDEEVSRLEAERIWHTQDLFEILRLPKGAGGELIDDMVELYEQQMDVSIPEQAMALEKVKNAAQILSDAVLWDSYERGELVLTEEGELLSQAEAQARAQAEAQARAEAETRLAQEEAERRAREAAARAQARAQAMASATSIEEQREIEQDEIIDAGDDLYARLGITPDSDGDIVNAAMRELIKVHHPDRGGDPDIFQRIMEAYNILKDPERRAQYDREGLPAPSNEAVIMPDRGGEAAAHDAGPVMEVEPTFPSSEELIEEIDQQTPPVQSRANRAGQAIKKSGRALGENVVKAAAGGTAAGYWGLGKLWAKGMDWFRKNLADVDVIGMITGKNIQQEKEEEDKLAGKK